MKKRIFFLLFLVAAVVGAGYYFTVVRNAGRGNLLSGTIEATEVKVSAEISGRVLEVTADEGDRVEKGKLLVRLDHETLDAQLAQAQASKITAQGQLAAAGASMQEAKINLGRSENLLDAGSISAQKFDSAKTAREVFGAQRQSATGQIKSAEANADFIRAQIAKATIDSPLGGTVLKRTIELGELAMPGTTLFDVADMEHPWVRVYIPETQLGRVKIGQAVKVHSDSWPGKVYDGKVVTVASQAEFTPKNVQTKEERVRLVYSVKVDVANPAGELKIGMPVDAELVE